MPSETDAKETALSNYRQLLAKVDEKFAEIAQRNTHQMRCAKGCHSCCQPNLTVNPLEAFAIRSWLTNHPESREKIAQLVRKSPHDGSRCLFLDGLGSCVIYEARPIVCRSHGAPIRYRTDGKENRDFCPLNFSHQVAEIPDGDFINLDLLNTLLALISQQFGPSEERVPLDHTLLDESSS